MNKLSTTHKTVLSGVVAALVCVFTFVRISLAAGYFNFGDVMIFMAAFIMPDAAYYVAAAGIGSAITDLISGFPVYIPATLVIKSAMALFAYSSVNRMKKNFSRVLMMALAALMVPIGYFLYEIVLLGAELAVADLPFNALQGLMGVTVGCISGKLLGKRLKNKILK